MLWASLIPSLICTVKYFLFLPSTPFFPEPPRWLRDKESACNAGDTWDAGSILAWGRSPGEANGHPLQYGLQSKGSQSRTQLKDGTPFFTVLRGKYQQWSFFSFIVLILTSFLEILLLWCFCCLRFWGMDCLCVCQVASVVPDSLWPHGLYIGCRAPQSMGFRRQDYWNGLSCPLLGDLPNPGTELMSLMSPALTGGFFITSTTWEAQGMG